MRQSVSLNINRDLLQPARSYREMGFATVNEVLAPPAARLLRDAASAWTEWNLVALIEGKHRDFIVRDMEALAPERRAPFENLVHQEARTGFGYLFENVPLYESGLRGTLTDPVFRAAFDLIRSDAFIKLGRSLTGDSAINFADCQLTRYRPGHFLTRHDDSIEGKNRSAAYVLNLTDNWSADFGGVLHLLDSEGDVRAGLTPQFNRLTVFKVPQPHAVSVVAPFAPGARLAITGWFRRGAAPAL